MAFQDIKTVTPNYENLIESTGVSILFLEEDGDYQGDSMLLLQDGETSKYGLLVFGWGSCSGCDSLEAARGYDEEPDYIELESLRYQLYHDIRWFDSIADMQKFLENDDFVKTQWWGHDNRFNLFKVKLSSY